MSEELIAASKERIADLLEPVNGGAGEDISYDEKFEEIKAEVEKISSLAGETPNWGDVAVNAEELLQEKSKDFRVACYLATCKCLEGKLESVLDALLLLRQITDTFWDEMFPPLRRIRARAGMVGWWSDQSGGTVIDIKLTAKDGALVTAIEAESGALDTLFREKFADHYTGMSKIRDGVRHLVRSCPKDKAKAAPKAASAPVAAAATPARPAPVVASSAIDVGDVTSIEQAERALEPCGMALVKVGRSFRLIKPEHNMAYRLSRLGVWLEFTATPPAEDGQTLVPPPPESLKDRFDTLVGASDFLTLLNEAEDAAAEFPCWLDPHRYVATAMSAMGALFMKARSELLLNVALFLRRLPSMSKLHFNDGTPFADGQTIMWIEQEVAGVLGAGAGDGDGAGGGAGGSGVLDEPIKEARGLAVKGELGKALGVVAGAAAGAPTPAEKFRGKLAMAQLCLGAGQYAIARGQLEGLTTQIDSHQLTGWDPNLCGDVYAALFAAIKGMNDDLRPKGNEMVAAAMVGDDEPAVPPEEEAAELAAFQQLCRLDPAVALKLSGG